MKKFLLILFLIFAFAQWGEAAVYYVDSSITDVHVASATPDFTTYNPVTFATDTGTDSVYKTIADVNLKAFAAGDFVYFRKSQTWRERLTIPSSGSVGLPITYGSFGIGAKPQILGSTQLTTWDVDGSQWKCTYAGTVAALFFINASDGTIHWGQKQASQVACTAEYYWYSDGSSVWCFAATDPDTRYTSVEATTGLRCITHNSKIYITIQDLELAFGSIEGIGAGNVAATNWTIQRNTVHHFGIWPLGGSSNPGIGIAISKSHVISYNKVYEIGGGGIQCYGYADVDQGNFIVNNNEVYNVYYEHLNFHIDAGTVNNCVIKYNLVYDTSNYADTTKVSDGIYVSGNSTHAADSWNIYYNIVHDMMGSGIKWYRYVTNCNIYNNTVYKSNANIGALVSYGIGGSTTGCSGIVIKNNIAIDFSTACFFPDTIAVISACDYNLWYQSAGGTAIYVEVASPYKIYHYNDQATYKSDQGFDTNGKWADPLVVSATDFHLKPDSPARDAGVGVGLYWDYAGNAVPSGYGTDIGAYELPQFTRRYYYGGGMRYGQ
jgi:hypothetical protein